MRMHFLALAGLVAACAPVDSEGDFADELSFAAEGQAPVPIPMTLSSAGVMYPGIPNQLTVTGAPANERVVLGLSTNPTGTPFCPNSLAPECLGIAQPISILARDRADGAGTVAYDITPPGGIPFGVTVALQAGKKFNGDLFLSNVDTIVTADPCVAPVSVSAAGSSNYPVLADLVVTFDGPLADDATYTIAGVAASPVLSADDTVATFPAPLAGWPATAAVTLSVTDVCGNDYDTDFTTGNPDSFPPEALTENGWRIDLDTATVVSPAALASFAGPLIGDFDDRILLFGTNYDASTETVDFELGGVLDDGAGNFVQDPCIVTSPVPGVDFSTNPDVSVSVVDTTPGAPLPEIGLDATFMDFGASAGDVQVTALIDAGFAATQAGLGTAGDICFLLFLTGEPCVSCPSGGDCIEVVVTGGEAVEFTNPYGTVTTAEATATCGAPGSLF